MSEWSVSGTHKAQEIKAVNKGPSDKGSPDSYESRAGLGLAAGSFRTRADGHEKTNHSDEHEGHHLHLPLPIHTYFHLFFFLPFLAIIYPTSFFLIPLHQSFPLLFLFSCMSHWIQLSQVKEPQQPGDTDKMCAVLTIKLTLF